MTRLYVLNRLVSSLHYWGFYLSQGSIFKMNEIELGCKAKPLIGIGSPYELLAASISGQMDVF